MAITVGAPVFGADLRFHGTTLAWLGLGQGHGLARGRQVEVSLSGRRVPQPRHAQFWLPGADGALHPVVPLEQAGQAGQPVVVPLRRTG